MPSPRLVRAVREIPVASMGPQLSSREVHQALAEQELDPFLVISLFEMSGPVFPPHPHAGFSVATYILPESAVGFFNQDSLGTRNEIKPGGLHATVAGAGVLHEEQPTHAGQLARGYQIWIDHRNGARSVPPRPETLEAADVPQFTANGVTVRVLIGGAHTLESPVRLPTPVRLLDGDLGAHATWHAEVSDDERGFLVVISGSVTVGDMLVPAGHVGVLDTGGTALAIQAGDQGARCTLFAGIPLIQPRVFGGPVVGGTRDEVQAFLRAASIGGFGTLSPMG
jgi:quercetin 2,3-dioxygenase